MIIQYTIISAIISYFMGTLYNRGGKKYLLAGTLFLLPPAIIHILYPIRLCMFAFLELLFFFILNEKRTIVGYKTIILVVGLNIILTVWRTECTFFIAFIPIYLIYKKYSVKVIAITTISLIISSVILISANNYCAGTDEIRYKVTGLVRPFHALLLEDYEKNDSNLIKEIDDIIDIKEAVLYDDGESAYWADVYKDVDTKDKLKKMEYVLLELATKYPNVLLKERWDIFYTTGKVLDKNGNLSNMVKNGNVFMSSGELEKNFGNFIKSKPLNIDLRARVLLFLYSKGSNQIIGNIIRWTYNLILPIILLILLLIFSIIKKDGVLLLSILFLLAQASAVIITAPLPVFMYYFPIYMCSYGLFITKAYDIFNKLYKSIKKRCHI